MAIAGVYINARELETLLESGLPHLAVVLYLLAMRPRMDFRRATLGIEPSINWQALREYCYEEPTGGKQRGAVSIKSVRNAAEWLRRAGLIEFRTSERRLIFYFPLAAAHSHVQNKPGKNRADQPGRPSQREKPMKPDRPKEDQPGKHPSIKEACLTTSSLLPAPEDSSLAPVGATGIADAIQWPNRWPFALRRNIARLLADAPRGSDYFIPQALVDELNGAQQKTDIANPVAYMRRLVDKAKAGDFAPEWGIVVAMQRQQTPLSEKGRATVLDSDPPRALAPDEEAALRRMFPNHRRFRKEASNG